VQVVEGYTTLMHWKIDLQVWIHPWQSKHLSGWWDLRRYLAPCPNLISCFFLIIEWFVVGTITLRDVMPKNDSHSYRKLGRTVAHKTLPFRKSKCHITYHESGQRAYRTVSKILSNFQSIFSKSQSVRQWRSKERWTDTKYPTNSQKFWTA